MGSQSSGSVPGEQASLAMAVGQEIDEHGDRDPWDRGSVRDESGHFDLGATQDLLAERFRPYKERLPDTVGDYKQVSTDHEYKAVYETTAEFENSHGKRVLKQRVTILPVGPHLNAWTIAIKQWHPEPESHTGTGFASWHHQDSRRLDSIGAAIATALAVMRGYIPPRRGRNE
jgi:hypothetical protein